MAEKGFIEICPNENELSYVGPSKCPTCNVVFTNSASCEMHQIKKHKKDSKFLEKKVQASYRYFCPRGECKYNPALGLKRYFTKMKYLKQHYLKSHAEKTFSCGDCDKSFSTSAQLNSHVDKECGIEFRCIQCDASYKTREALLTHCYRTRHINTTIQTKKKGKIEFVHSPRGHCRKILPKPCASAPHLMENIAAAALSELSRTPVVRHGVEASTQTTPETKKRSRVRVFDASTNSLSTQTDKDYPFEPDSDSLNMVLREYLTSATQTNQDVMFDLGMFPDIDQHVNNETQTELIPANLILDVDSPHHLSDTHTQTAALDEYSHNCTQTCDDIFLNDFIDIETQTAWASLNVDSLLVSAQTQTLL